MGEPYRASTQNYVFILYIIILEIVYNISLLYRLFMTVGDDN